MSALRPAGRSLRHPTDADALAVVELLRARERADLGREQATAEDLREEWAVAGFDLATDAWLAEEDGALAGYACLLGDDLLVAVHPGAAGRGIGSRLREAGERRAEERGTRVLRQFIPAADTSARVQLLDSGWWPVHHYFSLRMPLERAPEPPDVIVRRFDAAADLEPVWRLVQDTYASLEGFLSQPLEAWRATTLDKPGWDPALRSPAVRQVSGCSRVVRSVLCSAVFSCPSVGLVLDVHASRPLSVLWCPIRNDIRATRISFARSPFACSTKS